MPGALREPAHAEWRARPARYLGGCDGLALFDLMPKGGQRLDSGHECPSSSGMNVADDTSRPMS